MQAGTISANLGTGVSNGKIARKACRSNCNNEQDDEGTHITSPCALLGFSARRAWPRPRLSRPRPSVPRSRLRPCPRFSARRSRCSGVAPSPGNDVCQFAKVERLGHWSDPVLRLQGHRNGFVKRRRSQETERSQRYKMLNEACSRASANCSADPSVS